MHIPGCTGVFVFLTTSDDETIVVEVCETCRQFSRRPITEQDRLMLAEAADRVEAAFEADRQRALAGEYGPEAQRIARQAQ